MQAGQSGLGMGGQRVGFAYCQPERLAAHDLLPQSLRVARTGRSYDGTRLVIDKSSLCTGKQDALVVLQTSAVEFPVVRGG